MKTVRAPAVAGQFYAGTATGLREQIESAFTHELGPGAVPSVREEQPGVKTLVSPHAGYPYSGPVAAHGFAALAEAGQPEVAVIVGPNHTGVGEAVAISEADRWQTPMGDIPVARELRERFLERSNMAKADDHTHEGEHSLEVQVPFLQYLFEDLSILPIVMTDQDETTASELGETLAGVLEGVDRSTVLIASTDMTHYEPQEVAEEKDRQAIDRMEKLDVEGLYETIAAEDISMCGYGPTAVGLALARRQGANSGDLLRYGTSGDTSGSTAEVVGYASVAVR